jgi:UDP-N-acetylmuramoyl-L-alanyl-D-glutamate--2,6-diaminopimelate ligase
VHFDALVQGLTGRRVGAGDPAIERVVRHSGEVRPGDLFAALVGAAVDAHRFVPDAVARGAAALLLDARGALAEGAGPDELPVPSFVADDSRAALAVVADRFYGHPFAELRAVAVTGTNGKTTTTLMLESVFGAAGLPCGVVGTIFFRLGMWEIRGANTTPDALDLFSLVRAWIDRGARAVALEASSHGLETHRLDGALFDVAVFTNLSRDHLDFHGDMEAYFQAKRRLFTDHLAASRAAGKLGLAVINGDDPHGRRLLEEHAAHAVSYGLTDESDVHASDLALTPAGTRFTLHLTSGTTRPVHLPLAGRYNVSNALGAAAAAEACGVSPDAIVAGLEGLPAVPGRVQRVTPEGGAGAATGPSVFVDYAHTPDALALALEALAELAPSALWVVFGCGGDRDRGKRPVMGRVAAERADVVVVTNDNPRSERPADIVAAIVEGARDAGVADLHTIEDRREAIHFAVTRAPADAIVLVAGKGHEQTQTIGDRVLPFDDVAVAREALAARGGRP